MTQTLTMARQQIVVKRSEATKQNKDQTTTKQKTKTKSKTNKQTNKTANKNKNKRTTRTKQDDGCGGL